ncbi:MAG: phenylacetate--CoA ligase family protein [Candidatus Hodarchaeota archaeon]
MNEWFAKNVVYRSIQMVRKEKVLKYLSTIKEIPWYSRDEIEDIQRQKLFKTLKCAYKNIPYYHNLFDQYGIEVEKLKLPEDVCKIPILTKDDFREHNSSLINRNENKRLSYEKTSGTSGKPLTICIDRDKSAHIRAQMFRNYDWYHIHIGDKQGRFWGVPVAKRSFIKEKIKDILANRIRLSAFEINDISFNKFVKKLIRFKPKYFYGYPSLIYEFCQWLINRGIELKDLNLLAIITSGEVLYDFQRELIEKCFGCKVANEYGATEIGVIAFECTEGNLHINSDHVYLETIKSDKSGDLGQIIVTELDNYYNPLIRYKIGDLGTITDIKCKCGSGFPIIMNLVGRDNSFIITDDNRYIYPAVFHYIFNNGGIKQFQGIQKTKTELLIKIIKKDDLTEVMLKDYKDKLSNILGNSMIIKFDIVDRIEKHKSGKLRYFVPFKE